MYIGFLGMLFSLHICSITGEIITITKQHVKPREKCGLVPHLTLCYRFQMLAIRRFSIGFGRFHQFLFIDGTVDRTVSLNTKYIVKRKAFSFSTDNVKLVRLFHLLRTQAVRGYHRIQKFLLC